MANSSLLLVQDYLLSHSLAQLEKDHGVNSRVDGHKFSLNYDQLSAKDGDPLAKQCRGLVLRTAHGHPVRNEDEVVGLTVVLARPFDRFFNFGQGAAAPVDFGAEDTCFFEKLDGTLIILYHDDLKTQDKWSVATRSVCEANLPVDGFQTHTFRTLFIEAVEKTTGLSWKNWTKSLETSKDFTFCFELMTPHNTVVVRHDTFKVALLTVRHRVSGVEANFKTLTNIAGMLSVPTAPSHSFKTVEDLVSFVNSRNGMDYEGVVVCDAQHRRVKVKSPAYLAASRAKSIIGSSPRNLLELILLGTIDDVLPILTDAHKTMAEEMREKLRLYLSDFNTKWMTAHLELDGMGHMSDHNRRKEFARLTVRYSLWMSPAMNLYEEKSKDLEDWISKQKRKKDGSFQEGFLDNLLRELKNAK